MDASVVAERIAELLTRPSTTEPAGSILQEFVRQPDVYDVLELGFDQGVSTAYLAAALDGKQRGMVTTIDRPASLEKRPNIETVLRHVGVRDQVEPVVETSYNWALMHLLARQLTVELLVATRPDYVLHYVAGARLLTSAALTLRAKPTWTTLCSPTKHSSGN